MFLGAGELPIVSLGVEVLNSMDRTYNILMHPYCGPPFLLQEIGLDLEILELSTVLPAAL